MEEEKQMEEPKAEEPQEEENVSAIDAATKLKDLIKAENDRREEILKREEKLHAERMLAGTAGGGVPKEEPKEETPEEYKNRVMRGEI